MIFVITIIVTTLVSIDPSDGFNIASVPKEAEAYHKQLLSDSLSYSYSALEFGGANDTQVKTITLIRNLSRPGFEHRPVSEVNFEDSRWSTPKPVEYIYQIPDYYPLPYQPLFVTPLTTTTTKRPQLLSLGYNVDNSNLFQFPETRSVHRQNQKAPKPLRSKKNRRVKSKNRTSVGLDGVLYIGLETVTREPTIQKDLSPKLSSAYSKVVQNTRNSLPTVVFSQNLPEPPLPKKPNRVDLSKMIKTRPRHRHRYSSNYLVPNPRRNNDTITKIKPEKGSNQVVSVYPVTTTFNFDKEYVTTSMNPSFMLPAETSTEPSLPEESNSESYHPTITKIPGRETLHVVLNVTTEVIPKERRRLSARTRLKAIRKIVRRLPS